MSSNYSESELEDYCAVDFNNFQEVNNEILDNEEGFQVIQINGRRVYGPPPNWSGPPPPNGSEIYVSRIPRNMNESELIPLFQRFGQIYELRLMMDYNNQNRGYCYIRYTNEVDACRAMEVMNNFLVRSKKSLSIKMSYDKCRLFVGNLPRELEKSEIENTFKTYFPKMEGLVMHNRISDEHKNRGFGFIDFSDHKSALEAKQKCSPGILMMWNRDIKVMWATPERTLDPEALKTIRTLFIRNVELSVSSHDMIGYVSEFVDRNLISKVTRVRELAFVEFASRDVAEIVMQKMQGKIINGFKIDITWALPPNEKSIHSLKNYDFDALFRLKCIANLWDPPIIIYGRVFEKSQTQNVAVLIRNKHRCLFSYFIEIHLKFLTDIQSRVFEALIEIVIDYGGLPPFNLIISIDKDDAYIIGHFPDIRNTCPLVASNLQQMFNVHLQEIQNLCIAAFVISEYSFDEFKGMYYEALAKGGSYNYLEMVRFNDRLIGCLRQNHRMCTKLKYDLDNTEIVLVLCNITTGTNYIFPNVPETQYTFINTNPRALPGTNVISKQYNLLPLNFIQRSSSNSVRGIFYGHLSQQFYELDKSTTRSVVSTMQPDAPAFVPNSIKPFTNAPVSTSSSVRPRSESLSSRSTTTSNTPPKIIPSPVPSYVSYMNTPPPSPIYAHSTPSNTLIAGQQYQMQSQSYYQPISQPYTTYQWYQNYPMSTAATASNLTTSTPPAQNLVQSCYYSPSIW